MTILYRAQRTAQPQAPVDIDWTNPLAANLRHAWHWGPSGSALARDYAFNGHVTSLASSELQGRQNPLVESMGKVCDFDGYVTGKAYGCVVPGGTIYPMNGTSGVTTLVLFNIKDSGYASSESAFWRKAAAGSSGIAFGVFPGSAKKLRPLIATSGTTGWSASYDVNISDMAYNQVSAAAFTYESASRKTYYGPTPSSLTLRDTRTAITGTISVTNSHDLHIGGMAETSGYSFPGSILAVFIWDRVLSEIELREVAANPWQLFAPIQRRIWVGATGGGGTIVDLVAASFGFTPQATQNKRQTTMTAASMAISAQAIQNKRTTTMTAGSFAMSAQPVQNKRITTMTAAAFAFAATSIQIGGQTVIDLVKAAFGMSASPIQNKQATSMTSASFGMNAQPLQPSRVTKLTSAAFGFTANALTLVKTTVISLTAATFFFSGKAIEATGAIAAAYKRMVRSLVRNLVKNDHRGPNG